MPEDQFDEDRYLDMVKRAGEVKYLSQDDQLKQEAEQQLQKLSQLRAAYA